MTTRAVMTVGSLTKQFTGTAIALLEEEGLLSLDDSLGEFFADVPEDKRAIRVRHLLSHTAGLPPALGHDWDLGATRDWLLETAMETPLRSPPGTRRAYSNVGYSLLAMIVEERTGESYEDFLLAELFLPAGMEHTGMVLPDFDGMLFPTGYQDGVPSPTFVDQPMLEDGPSWNLRGNGGVLSTVEDMARWYRALHGELFGSTVARRLDAPLAGSTADGYGYGWGHATSRRGTHMVEHDGGNGIFFADFHRYVDEDTAIFLMTSNREWKAEDVIEALDAIVFGHESLLPPLLHPLPAAHLEGLAGDYELPGGDRISVEAGDGRLFLAADGAVARDLLQGGDGEPDAARAGLEERCLAITEAFARNGDFGPLEEAAGDQVPVAALSRQLRESPEFGPETDVRVKHLWTRPGGHGLEVIVKIGQGSEALYALYSCRGEKILGFGVDTRAPLGGPADSFYPTSELTFESFGLLAGRALRIELDGKTLEVRSASRPWVAHRIDGSTRLHDR
jgi:hypothetical protein